MTDAMSVRTVYRRIVATVGVLAVSGLSGLGFDLAKALLALLCRAHYFDFTQSGKEGRAVTTFFRHYRQRGPVNALQMRLQG